MMEIKIKDSAFGHTDYSTLQKTDYFKWIRTNESRNVCFFTDSNIGNVSTSNDKVKVAWLIEPRAINPTTYNLIVEKEDLFDYILTYDSTLLKRGKKYLFYPHGGCWIDDKQLYEKTKFCSIIASSKNFTSGHRLRHSAIKKLGDKFDVYGNGYKAIDNKLIGLKDYKFSIVIENSQQDDYFTEKLIDTLLTGTIPLFWGTKNINTYFTNIPTFNTIDELEHLISYYKLNEYPESNIKLNYDTALGYSMPEKYFFEHYNFLFK